MLQSFQSQLPPAVRMRAETLGASGAQWLTNLDDSVRALAARWAIDIGAVLSGGSEGLVAHAQLADGRSAVLKIGLSGSADLATEAKVFALAGGRGYAELLAYDAEHNAILLERLGPRLRSQVNGVEAQIRVLCDTLNEAWLPLDGDHGLITGAQKAHWLADFIRTKWEALGFPCERRTVELALDFAGQRAAAFSPANAVLVHGDAHADNTLLSVDAAALRYKFVDPDGLFAEKACDLAVPMRDWSRELLLGDTVRAGWERCELLARLTNVDERAIWQWGFIERVSTGLVLREIGMSSESAEMLTVADRLNHESANPRG